MTATENYLRDVLSHLVAEARSVAAEAPEVSQDSFKAGRRMAYYEVISYLVQQLDAFQIPRKDFGLAEFDPERELL